MAQVNETNMADFAHWPSHPIADLFPRMSPEERDDLKRDMIERVEQNIDPLEHSILLYDKQIVDGRHRAEVWKELADEGACNGFFKRNLPPTELVTDKHSTLVAWMRAKSANMVHRHIPADQKAAIFLKAVKVFPELKNALDQIKDENAQRKKKGKPLVAGDQRGNTAEAIGKMAGVGATTVKMVASLQNADPPRFEEVVQGTKTAKKAAKEIQEGKNAKSNAAPDSDVEDAVGEDDPTTKDHVPEEQEEEGDKKPLLDEVRHFTQSITEFLQLMDKVDWSKQDHAKWTEASEALKDCSEGIATKVRQGLMKSTQKGKPPNPKATSTNITIRKLNSDYGPHAAHVLKEYLEKLERGEGIPHKKVMANARRR